MRLALPVVLAALLLAGCGGSDSGGGSGGGPTSIVAAAIKASEDTESSRMSFVLDSHLGGEKIRMDGEGVVAADNSRARIKGNFGEGGSKEPIEMISNGDDWWMRGPQFDAALPAGKKWLHMTEPSTTTMTPSEFLDFLRESQGIKEVGREDVRGRPTVHLRGPVDMKELAESTDSPLADQFAKAPQAAELETEIEVWVAEDDDRMARMALTMTHPDAPGRMSMTADILEYDVSLDEASAPPKDEVAEASELGG